MRAALTLVGLLGALLVYASFEVHRREGLPPHRSSSAEIWLDAAGCLLLGAYGLLSPSPAVLLVAAIGLAITARYWLVERRARAATPIAPTPNPNR